MSIATHKSVLTPLTSQGPWVQWHLVPVRLWQDACCMQRRAPTFWHLWLSLHPQLGQELSLCGTFGLELAKLSLLSCFRHLWVNRWAFARSSACSDLHSVIVSPPYCETESNSRVCFKISSVWLCVPQRHVFDLAYDMISWLNG